MSREPFIKPLNGFAKMRAPQSVSNAALAEINPRKATAVQPEPRTPSQREQTIHTWVSEFKFGQEYDALGEFLSADSLEDSAALLKERLREMYGEAAYANPEHIEKAYISILNDGLLDRYEAEAARNAKKYLESAATEQVAETADEYSPVPLASWEEIAKLKKLASTRKGLAQLRREAIFGGPVETVPMSGTARRF